MSIKIRWPFRNTAVITPTFDIDCEMFTPNGKQPLAEEFVVDGQVHSVVLPPWACRDTDSARQNIRKFMMLSQDFLEDEILETLEDPVLLYTWHEAKRFRDTRGSSLITQAMQIYAGAMMNSKYPSSVELNAFGISESTPAPHFFEKLPLPPQLTMQIQIMAAQVLQDIQGQLLKELKARIFTTRSRQTGWYEIFLTMSVLLASIEWVYQVQMRFERAKEGVSQRLSANIKYITRSMLDEWENSSSNIVNHFRCVLNGDIPFTQSWDDGSDNARDTGIDKQAVSYIRKIKAQIDDRSEEFHTIRADRNKGGLERPLSAVCQLFLPMNT